MARRATDTALDRAKRVQNQLRRIVERRERAIEKAAGDFRLDMLAAVDAVDDATLDLVQRALAQDHGQHGLELALQLAVDERTRNRATPPTRRSGDDDDDGHEAETDPPPPFVGEWTAADAAAHMRDAPLPRFESDDAPHVLSRGRAVLPGGDTVSIDAGEYRYPEPGEPATVLPDGTVVAA